MLSNKHVTCDVTSQSSAVWGNFIALNYFYFSCSQVSYSLPTRTLLPLKSIIVSSMLSIKPGHCQLSPSAAISISLGIQMARDMEHGAEQESLWLNR